MTFAVTDLLLADDALEELRDALSNSGTVTSVETVIAESVSTVESYTAAYTVDDARLRDWVRVVALWKLFSLAGAGKAPEGYKAAYDAALKELEGVRDGKFPYAPASAGVAATGDWGSQTRLAIMGDPTES